MVNTGSLSVNTHSVSIMFAPMSYTHESFWWGTHEGMVGTEVPTVLAWWPVAALSPLTLGQSGLGACQPLARCLSVGRCLVPGDPRRP